MDCRDPPRLRQSPSSPFPNNRDHAWWWRCRVRTTSCRCETQPYKIHRRDLLELLSWDRLVSMISFRCFWLGWFVSARLLPLLFVIERQGTLCRQPPCPPVYISLRAFCERPQDTVYGTFQFLLSALGTIRYGRYQRCLLRIRILLRYLHNLKTEISCWIKSSAFFRGSCSCLNGRLFLWIRSCLPYQPYRRGKQKEKIMIIILLLLSARYFYRSLTQK